MLLKNQGYEWAHWNTHPHLSSVGTREGTSAADSKLQDLEDTGRQQDILRESQRGPSIESVAETTDLKPDQPPFAMHLRVEIYG